MRADDQGMVGQQVVLGEGGWVIPLPVISAVPDTPAAEAEPPALTRDEAVDLVASVPSVHPAAIVDALADRGVLRLVPTRENDGLSVGVWRFPVGARLMPFQPPITGPGYLLQCGNQVGVYDVDTLDLRAVYELTDDGSVFELDSTRTRSGAFGGVGLVEQQPDHRRAFLGQPPTG